MIKVQRVVTKGAKSCYIFTINCYYRCIIIRVRYECLLLKVQRVVTFTILFQFYIIINNINSPIILLIAKSTHNRSKKYKL